MKGLDQSHKYFSRFKLISKMKYYMNNNYFSYLGEISLLQQPMLAVFCSHDCPGTLMLKAFDFARNLSTETWVLIGGFHSQVEKDVLLIWLKSGGRAVICLARWVEKFYTARNSKTKKKQSRNPDIDELYKIALRESHLLYFSPFNNNQMKVDSNSAYQRDKFIAGLSEKVLFIFASQNGTKETLAYDFVKQNEGVYAIDDEFNNHLFAKGVKKWNSESRFMHDNRLMTRSNSLEIEENWCGSQFFQITNSIGNKNKRMHEKKEVIE
jgi:hypothetical protein